MFQECENSLGNTLRGAHPHYQSKKLRLVSSWFLEAGKFSIMVLAFGECPHGVL